ncbi:plastocyanin/azurin family copper-binding protein [Rapidithrix thailandica]
MLQKGEVFTSTFKEAGVYHYYCQAHKIMGMKGQYHKREQW